MRLPIAALALAAAMFSGACSSSSNDDDDNSPPPGNPPPPGSPPLGLTAKPAFSGADLPTDSGTPRQIELVDAFPNLNFSAAIFLTAVPGENRLVVVEQGGRVLAFVDDPATADSRVVLDLSAVVLFSGEQGLLGFAFDPNFTTNRYVYVHYSRSNPRRSVIARFTWDAAQDVASLGSEKIILELEQPRSNHNGGMLAFSPIDEYLYIAFGDGGGAGDPDNLSQNGQSLHGKILRLDVHPGNDATPYLIPPGNPFAADASIRDEVWALGLRNPFRFSFDRQNGTLWLGDVGQNAREEIDIIDAGGNYGWRVFEGQLEYDRDLNTLPDSAFTPPIYDFPRTDGRSVIGGYVYRGTGMASLIGNYVYTDFVSGTIWSLVRHGDGSVTNTPIGSASGPTSFGEDSAGELFVVTQGGGVYALQETAGNPDSVPTRLSETGLFQDTATLEPTQGLIEYDVNVPFWSDGTLKRRWLAIPTAATIDFDAVEPWSFPVGAVLVKHFDIDTREGDPSSRRRLETRVLLRADAEWVGFTYRWNALQNDADLVSSRSTETLNIELAAGGIETFDYEYPGGADCLQCHTQSAGFGLGVKTRQLNRDFDYPQVTDNQLRTLNGIGMFSADIGAADEYDRFAADARSYLDSNCANCHRPGGSTPTNLDLRYDAPLAAMNVVDEAPNEGDLGIGDARIVAPGSKETSVLWERMRRLDEARMPPLGSHRVDQAGVELVGAWIDAM